VNLEIILKRLPIFGEVSHVRHVHLDEFDKLLPDETHIAFQPEDNCVDQPRAFEDPCALLP
jgi:hypothetical protein